MLATAGACDRMQNDYRDEWAVDGLWPGRVMACFVFALMDFFSKDTDADKKVSGGNGERVRAI